MAGLLLAGVLSGAGQGLQQSLDKTQTWYAWQQLEKTRQEMETVREDKKLKAASTLQAEKIRADAEQGKLSRENALELAKIHGDVTKTEGAFGRASHEKIAESTQATNIEIAKINKKAINDTHEADRALKEWELAQSKEAAGFRNDLVEAIQSGDKTKIKAAKDAYAAYAEKPWESEKVDLTSAVNGMRETGTEITRLSVALKDPMIDRKGADYAAMSRQLETATAAHAAFTARVQDLSGSKKEAPEPGSRGEMTTDLWNTFVNQNPGKPVSALKAAAEKMGFTFPESFGFGRQTVKPVAPTTGGLIQSAPSGVPPGVMGGQPRIQ